MTRHPLHARTALAAVVFALALAGCGSSGDDSATTAATGAATSEAGSATTGTTRATTASSAATADSAAPASTDDSSAADPSAMVIEATVSGGKVTVAEDRFEVAKGTDVVIRVTDDVEEPIHLHGYDIEVDAAPGKPAEIAFTADIPGVFEVELEDSGTLLFEIEVK